MDPLYIVIAFAFGLAVRQVGLPPLVGYLAAGFALNAFGQEGGEALQKIADVGVTILLFSIGLKLDLKSLVRPEVSLGAALHMGITVLVFGGVLAGVGAAGLLAGLDPAAALLIAFALSFSSTVFAVKVLETKGEMGALHGRVAIGILIMQDIFAVIFLTASSGKLPSIWALTLLALPIIRPVFLWIMDRCGHGELLLLYGLTLTLVVGVWWFGAVGLKIDLGALVVGVMVSAHPKAGEMAKSLLGFKDLLLVGFFVNIGISQVPTLGDAALALVLLALVPLKAGLFFWLLLRFRLRARTSFLTSLTLGNYSEFGLIVGAVGVAEGWIEGRWMVVISLALSASFMLAAPVNGAAHRLYDRRRRRLDALESRTRHPEEVEIPLPPGVEAVIVGMGRVGTSAYDRLRERLGDIVVGIDRDRATVEHQVAEGRRAICGDATDAQFWSRLSSPSGLRLLLLAMPNHREIMVVVDLLRRQTFPGVIAALAEYRDRVAELEAAGVRAFSFHVEAGVGFADHASAVAELSGAADQGNTSSR
jgi:predicted Kef-type K+ transport protein